jgi:uncharacterized membrane protein YbhN (UPF0104 family)
MGGAFECLSLAGYVVLLSLVAGRVTSRVGGRESAQITLAGAAATRLLPTAGAGGAALTLWALRRAGLKSRAAAWTLLVFLVALYSVFLTSIVLSGGALALGLVSTRGPSELSAIRRWPRCSRLHSASASPASREWARARTLAGI